MLHANIKNIFKDSSINYTTNRAKVLNFFLKQSKPTTLKDIKIYLGNFDRVTLFRILNLFEKKNIIHSIRIDSENTFTQFAVTIVMIKVIFMIMFILSAKPARMYHAYQLMNSHLLVFQTIRSIILILM